MRMRRAKITSFYQLRTWSPRRRNGKPCSTPSSASALPSATPPEASPVNSDPDPLDSGTRAEPATSPSTPSSANQGALENSISKKSMVCLSIERTCLLYTSDAADDLLCVDLGGRRIIKKKKK